MNMNRKERTVFISKVKRFARSQAGLKKIKAISPELAAIIESEPDYLDIPQYMNDPRVAGIYCNYIYNKPFYIGSTGNVYLRLAEHVYNFVTGSDAFGMEWSLGTPAHFEPIALSVCHEDMREFIEFKCIDKVKPILQYTDPMSNEYGIDKPIPDGETRDTIRPDIAVFTNLRVERAKEIARKFKEESKC